jgi:hypothetical protein
MGAGAGRCPVSGSGQFLADQYPCVLGPFAFGPPIVCVSPAVSPSFERDANPTARQLALAVGEKFLSESLTHSGALRNLCQQALT